MAGTFRRLVNSIDLGAIDQNCETNQWDSPPQFGADCSRPSDASAPAGSTFLHRLKRSRTRRGRPTERVLSAPEAAYTRELLTAIPRPPVRP
jgi:hypothetical protein